MSGWLAAFWLPGLCTVALLALAVLTARDTVRAYRDRHPQR